MNKLNVCGILSVAYSFCSDASLVPKVASSLESEGLSWNLFMGREGLLYNTKYVHDTEYFLLNLNTSVNVLIFKGDFS